MAGSRTTEDVYLKGKFKFMKHLRPDPKYPDKWATLLYPDEESLVKIKELKKQGIMNHLKMDDDGWYMNFSRPVSRTWKGQTEAMTAPRVVLPDNTPVEVAVGNGSDGILHLEVYQFQDRNRPGFFKKAARWVGARIDNLVRYDPNPDYSEAEQEELKKLQAVPAQLF